MTDVYAGAVKQLTERTYHGAIKRVISQRPLQTETLLVCPHHHRLIRKARDCAARMWAQRD
jgi:hypothetical protein